ncbi:MAG: hypothetical protein JXR76_31910 [Deltaproteobacteria bacterium]|nr:hypothetical protein [Deltaproteobacteria bacterium]
MIIVGIDENGLGPVLGPLVVTACAFRARIYSEDEFWALSDKSLLADDSKVVFKKNQKAKAETAVLKWLNLFALSPSDAHELYSQVCMPLPLPCPADNAHVCRPPKALAIPQYNASEFHVSEHIAARFETAGIHPLSAVAFTVCPGSYNDALDSGERNKLQLDFELMLQLVNQLKNNHPNEPILALCGKVGGTRCYSPWFAAAGAGAITILEENRDRSRYQLYGNCQMAFIKDGDSAHLPIAVASMVGKYLRELQMTEINERLRQGQPHISGYRDLKTKGFITETETIRNSLGIPDRCFIRNC